MSLISKDLPALIFLLIPGFIAAGVFYTLTAHPKTSEFERVIQSLIFTSIIKFLVLFVKPIMIIAGKLLPDFSLGPWNADVEFQWSIVLSVLVGMIFVLFANNDLFHNFMRLIRITTRTSYPSEWYGAFKRWTKASRDGSRVTLYLDGERRLRGWPEEWPDQPDKGHFVVEYPEWILANNQVAPLYKVKTLMVPASEVKMVEFLKVADEVGVPNEELERVERLLLSVQEKPSEDQHGSETASTRA